MTSILYEDQRDNKREAIIEEEVITRMGHISSELAHDLRSPLQTIQNAIFLIEKNPENKMFYDMVKNSLQQSTEILNSFRDYYKAHILKRLETDLRKVMELSFSDLHIPDNITVKKTCNDVTSVFIDPAKTALVFRKLIINSIEAMPEGGELEIILTDKQDHVQVSIYDTGIGVSPEVAAVIYEPFVKSKKNGNGLGVPSAKRIIESHGGQLSYSTKSGEGTVFTFTLPKKP